MATETLERLHGKHVNGLTVRGIISKDKQGKPIWECICQHCGSVQTHLHEKLLHGSAVCKSDSCRPGKYKPTTSRVTVATTDAKTEPTSVRSQAERNAPTMENRKQAIQEFKEYLHRTGQKVQDTERFNSLMDEEGLVRYRADHLIRAFELLKEEQSQQ